MCAILLPLKYYFARHILTKIHFLAENQGLHLQSAFLTEIEVFFVVFLLIVSSLETTPFSGRRKAWSLLFAHARN